MADEKKEIKNNIIVLLMIYGEFNRKILPFSLLYLGDALKKAGYKVKVKHITPKEIDETVDEIIEIHPLFVGISVLTGLPTKYSAQASKKIKKRSEIPIVWGGVHPSLLPHVCMQEDYIDFVVVGEGEVTIVELASAIERDIPYEKVKGIGYKIKNSYKINPERPFIKDLDSYSLDFDLINLRDYLSVSKDGSGNVIKSIGYYSSRGCPHRCGFCYNLQFNKRRWRGHSLERVVEDINFLKRRLDINFIYFWDDNFFTKKTRAFKILENTKRVGINSFIEIRIDYIDKDLAASLKKLGVADIQIGGESGSDRLLELMKKGFNSHRMLESARILGEYRIPVLYAFMLGLPSETADETNETIDLILDINSVHKEASFSVGNYLPYPGSDLYSLALQKGFSPPVKTEDWSVLDKWRSEINLPWSDTKKIQNIRYLTIFLTWRSTLVKKWAKFRLRHKILSSNIDIHIILIFSSLLNRIKNLFRKI